MSFGVFESAASSESEAALVKQAAADKLNAAIYDVREKLGPFLFGATSLEEFRDRVALCKSDQSLYRIVNDHLPPVTGTMRRIAGKNGALEQEFKAMQRTAWDEGDVWGWLKDKVPAATRSFLGPASQQGEGILQDTATALSPVSQSIGGPGYQKPDNKPADQTQTVGDVKPGDNKPGWGNTKPPDQPASSGTKTNPGYNTESYNYNQAIHDNKPGLTPPSATQPSSPNTGKYDPNTGEWKQNTNRSAIDPGFKYEVQAGDTLNDIAQRGGVSVNDLLKSNTGITDPNKINVGQSIQMPGTYGPGNVVKPSGGNPSGQQPPAAGPAPAGQTLNNAWGKKSSYTKDLVPAGNWEAYKKSRSQGAESKVKRNFQAAMELTAYADWCEANQLSPARLDSLDRYATHLSDAQYFRLARALQAWEHSHNPRTPKGQSQSRLKDVTAGWGDNDSPSPSGAAGAQGTVDVSHGVNYDPFGDTGMSHPGQNASLQSFYNDPLGLGDTPSTQVRGSSRHMAYDPDRSWGGDPDYADIDTNDPSSWGGGHGKHLRSEPAGFGDEEPLDRHPGPYKGKHRQSRRRTAAEPQFDIRQFDDVRHRNVPESKGYVRRLLDDRYGRPSAEVSWDDPETGYGGRNWAIHPLHELEVTGREGQIPTPPPEYPYSPEDFAAVSAWKRRHPEQGKEGRRHTAAPDYLQKADDALTQLLQQKAQEFQESVAPLQQALVTVQQAEQLQQSQNQMNVLPPPGTVNVMPGGDQGPVGMPAPGAQDLGGAAQALAGGGPDQASPAGGAMPPGGGAPSDLAQQLQAARITRTMVAMAMSKKHYVQIADAIKNLPPEHKGPVAESLANMFKADNPNFSHQKWFAAVGHDPNVMKPIARRKRGGQGKGRGAARPRQGGAADPDADKGDLPHRTTVTEKQKDSIAKGDKTDEDDVETNTGDRSDAEGHDDSKDKQKTYPDSPTRKSRRQAASVFDLWNRWQQSRGNAGNLGRGGEPDYEAFANEFGVGQRALQKLRKQHQQQAITGAYYRRWCAQNGFKRNSAKNWRIFRSSFQKGAPSSGNENDNRLHGPFAGYDSWEDCTSQNSDKGDADAYCGKIYHQVEEGRKRKGEPLTNFQDKQGGRHSREPEEYDEWADQVHWVPMGDEEYASYGDHGPTYSGGQHERWTRPRRQYRKQACWPGCHENEEHARKYHKQASKGCVVCGRPNPDDPNYCSQQCALADMDNDAAGSGVSWEQIRREIAHLPKRHAKDIKEPHRRTAWSGWGPAVFPRHRKVSGWDFDEHLNGYIARAPQRFACECGDEFGTPKGFHRCKCGKQWNSYVIGTGGNNHEASAEKFLVREIPVRENVIVANKGTTWHDVADGGHILSGMPEHLRDEDEEFGYSHDHPDLPDYPVKHRPHLDPHTGKPAESGSRWANRYNLTDPGELDEGEDDGTPTMKKPPADWHRRDKNQRWQKGPIGAS